MSADAVTDQERLDLFAIYWSLNEVNSRFSFEEALGHPHIGKGIRNVLRERRKVLARRRTVAANDAAHFALTP